mmetsp:Transcript_12725/g.19057  ORF Transcript_12725/g.19057 Transcript_12725/m.19057 type:complete len:168 (-) Transcript_12725:302-805(-)
MRPYRSTEKPITRKVTENLKKDSRFNAHRLKKATMPVNSNPIVSLEVPGAQSKTEKKTLTKKEVIAYMKSQKGFSRGLKKHEPSNIISTMVHGEPKCTLTKKVNNNRLTKRAMARARPVKMKRDNGNILAYSTMEKSASLKGIKVRSTQNDAKVFKKAASAPKKRKS